MPGEVIIADDGSGTETRDLIAKFQETFPVPLYHIWHQDAGFRKTIILNKAIAKSSFEYIVQIDGDVILDKHFIADHVQVAEQKAFVRGTRGMLSEKKTAKLLGVKAGRLSAFSAGVKHRNNALRIAPLSFLASRKQMSSNSVRGSNLAYWKADFIKVNGYDNTIAGWGHEDEELAARFINNGIIKKIVKLRAVQFHLYHPESSKSNEPQQRELVEKVKAQKIMACTDGYQQAAEYE